MNAKTNRYICSRNLLLIGLVILVAAVLAVGCSSGEDKKEVVFAYDNPAPVNYWRDQMQAWGETEEDIEVSYEEVPFAQLHDRYQTELLSGDPSFNVLHVRDDWIAEWAPKGWLHELDDLFTSDMRSHFSQGVLDRLSSDGHIYGVPLYFWITAFYYNTELFDEAGVSAPPKTWSELRDVAKKIQDATGVHGFCTALAATNPANFYAIMLRGEGGEVLTDGKPSFNNDAGVRALQYILDLIEDGTLHPSSLEQTNSVGSIDLFIQRECAMYVGPPPTLLFAANPDNSKIVGKAVVALVPGGTVNRTATYHENGARAIPADAEDIEAAWKFIEHIVKTDQMVDMALTLGRVPADKSALADSSVQGEYPLAAIIAEQLDSGPSGMAIVHENATEIGDALSKQLIKAFLGEATAEQALADAEADIEGIISR